jgi:folate-binding protein YgfZ
VRLEALFEAPEIDCRRIRRTAALIEFPERGIVQLAGPDGAAFLQGLVTNDVARLGEGRGCSAAILTPLGKIFAMLHVFRAGPDEFTLLLQERGGGRVAEFLERYHFGEDVEISDRSEVTAWLSLQGPAAPSAAAAAGGEGWAPEPYGSRTLPFEEGTLWVARCDEIAVPGLHFLAPRSAAPALRSLLERAAAVQGGGPAGLEAWAVCRVEAGVPWQGAELDESVLPMEAGLHAILDMDKGCYIGQEVVSRSMVQGRTNWSLWGLRLPPGSSIRPGEELKIAAKARPVVRVRSVARSPVAGQPLALAFVHREAARPGPLQVQGETGDVEVLLETLPFTLAPAAAGVGQRS